MSTVKIELYAWWATMGADAAKTCMQEGLQEKNTGLGERLEGRTEHIAAFKLDRSNAESHKYTVTSACWYPIDTGMFVTGSFDQEIKVGAFPLKLHVSQEICTDGMSAWALCPYRFGIQIH